MKNIMERNSALISCLDFDRKKEKKDKGKKAAQKERMSSYISNIEKMHDSLKNKYRMSTNSHYKLKNNRFSFKIKTHEEKDFPDNVSISSHKCGSGTNVLSVQNNSESRPKTDVKLPFNPFVFMMRESKKRDHLNVFRFYHQNERNPKIKVSDIVKLIYLRQYEVFGMFDLALDSCQLHELNVK